jgi:hypothetical protein
MPEQLTTSTDPQLTPPVTREPIRNAADTDDGAGLLWLEAALVPFADDDAE